MHHHPKPVAGFRRLNETVCVRAVQAAFQAVKHHQTGFMSGPIRIFAPGEIQKVTVRQVNALPVGVELHLAADQARQHGLQVRVSHTAHGHELCALFGCNVEV